MFQAWRTVWGHWAVPSILGLAYSEVPECTLEILILIVCRAFLYSFYICSNYPILIPIGLSPKSMGAVEKGVKDREIESIGTVGMENYCPKRLLLLVGFDSE